MLDSAEITPSDRVLLAFSFGPFVGFWSAFDALIARGALAIPGGGLGSLARIELIRRASVTTLFCTPTYALRLAEVAAEHHINLAQLSVEKIIVAGEPGGSVAGMFESASNRPGGLALSIMAGRRKSAPGVLPMQPAAASMSTKPQFIAEFISVDTGQPRPEGELSHLILTTLGRVACPVIRYRTGDLVRPVWPTTGAIALCSSKAAFSAAPTT